MAAPVNKIIVSAVKADRGSKKIALYKKSMKTKDEIIKWLKIRKLYGRFINQSFKASSSGEWSYSVDWDECTIECGFDWSKSIEGDRFWVNVNEDFREWYFE